MFREEELLKSLLEHQNDRLEQQAQQSSLHVGDLGGQLEELRSRLEAQVLDLQAQGQALSQAGALLLDLGPKRGILEVNLRFSSVFTCFKACGRTWAAFFKAARRIRRR